MSAEIVEVTMQEVELALDAVLENHDWPLTIEHVGNYTRRQDDTNGEVGREHELTVHLLKKGDVAVTLDAMSTIAFRSDCTVAASLRTRNAVIVLAEAIRRDNISRKQRDLSGGDDDLQDFMKALPKPLKKAINGLVEGAYWLRTIGTEGVYVRRSDDAYAIADGGFNQELQVTFSPDGDSWIILPFSMYSLRFRTYMGGGLSVRTRNALLVLAEAIRRDNEEHPQIV